MNADDFLEHHGVKGMKWGVRRSREERAAPSKVKVKEHVSLRGASNVTVRSRAGRGVVLTTGGRRNVATTDAVRTAASRQKGKKSTVHALSNAELKQAIERMKLEKDFHKLSKEVNRTEAGRKFAELLLRTVGKQPASAATVFATATIRAPRAIAAPTRAIANPRRAIGM